MQLSVDNKKTFFKRKVAIK